MNSSSRHRIIQLLRYCIAIAVLGWLIYRGDWSSTLDVLTEISLFVVFLLVLLSVVQLLIRFFMWYSLLYHVGKISYWVAAEIDMIVNFVNQLLPSQLSGRSIAPILISRRLDVSTGTAIGITSFHTMLHTAIYGVLAVVGIILIFESTPLGMVGLLCVSAALYLISGLLISLGSLNTEVIDSIADRLKPSIQRIPWIGTRLAAQFDRIPQFTSDAKEVFVELLNSPKTVAVYLLGWIGAVALFPSLRIFILFEAFGVSFPQIAFLPLIIISAYSVTLLPFAPGGIGITEATAAIVFTSLGVPYEIAVSSVLVDRVIGLYLPGLLGWYPTVREDLFTAEYE